MRSEWSRRGYFYLAAAQKGGYFSRLSPRAVQSPLDDSGSHQNPFGLTQVTGDHHSMNELTGKIAAMSAGDLARSWSHARRCQRFCELPMGL